MPMLRLASCEDKERLIEFCSKYPLGVRISCGTLAYGLEGEMFFAHIQLNEGGVIVAAVGNYCGVRTFVCSPDADYEELSLFLRGCKPLCGAERDFVYCGFEATGKKPLFEYFGSEFSPIGVKNDGDIRLMYGLVSRSLPGSFGDSEDDYLNFLSDYTFRKNRNMARLRCVDSDGTVRAACFTAAEDNKRGMISAVAVDESLRGKGLGRSVVISMAESLKAEGKHAFVIALNNKAEKFYSRIGFRKREMVCFYE